jgi:hypothetical protein
VDAVRPAIGRGELAIMHAVLKRLCHQRGQGPGTEAYGLLSALGASLGGVAETAGG